MKKFLSVLLALAVAFTFTFGSTMSAFATPESDAANAVKVIESLTPSYPDSATDDNGEYVNVSGYVKDEAAAVAGADLTGKYVKNAKGLFVAAPETATGGEITYTKSSSAYKIYVDQLNVYTAEAKIAAEALVYDTYNNLAGNVIASPADLGQFIMDNYGDKAAVAQLGIDQAALANAAKNASVADYATDDEIATITIDKTTYTKESSKAIAEKIVADTSAWIGNYPIGTVNTVGAACVAKAAIDEIFKNAISGAGTYSDPYKLKKNAEYRTYNYTTNDYDVNTAALVTTADKAVSDAEKAETIQGYEVNLSKAITATKKETEYAANKADWDAWLDAYKTAVTWLINNDNKAYSNTSSLKSNIATNDKLVDTVYQASRAIDAAVVLKAQTDEYDPELVDATLKALLKSVYNGAIDNNTAYTYNVTDFAAAKKTTVTAARKAGLKATESNKVTTEVINDVEYNKYGTAAYYELEWAKVTAALDAYYAAVDAATTEDDLTAAGNALKLAINNTDTKAVVDGYYTTGKLKKTYDAEMVKLNNYKNYLIASATSTNPLVITEEVDNVWYATKNARTDAEITALFNEAKAVYDTNKTADEWKKEASDVVAQIAALPAKAAITTADKDAIQAAKDAYDALPESYQKYVSNIATLNAAIDAVKAKNVEEIYYMAQKMPAVSTVTVADKAAVKAYYEAMDAFEKTLMYGAPRQYESAKITAQKLLDRIEKLEYASVSEAITSLPSLEKITASDKTAIEAARAAYDAFIAEYAEDYPADVAALGQLESKLVAAEKTVAAAVAEAEWTTTDVKASLFDSSRKLTIWRTSKTSIRVTSVGSVADIKDHGYTVEYKFYKKAPGATSYKFVKTTSNNKYTYTNLKKGTNKFQVKVVVKDADGKVVASKWTYYRAAKIK